MSEVGQEVRRQNYWMLWMIPLFLSGVGIVMIASLTSKSSVGGGTMYWMALKQLQFLGMGIILMCCCYLTPLKVMRSFSGLFWLFALFLTFCTLIPGVGVRVGGARRWINLGFIQFQPLEILILAVPVFLADRLTVSERTGLQVFLRPTISLALLSATPLFFQPNLGGIILVFAICLSMHVVDRGWKYPLMGGIIVAMLAVVLIYTEGYRMRRLLAFIDPWEDPMDRGFQIIQGMVAFSNGGLFGVGVGKGLQKLNYLPAAHTDYIFPAIGEEFGLLGTMFLLLLYALWTMRVYILFRRSSDNFTSLLIWGMVVSVLFPMFVNLAGVMKLMPLTGIPLPFLSAGGSALVFMWIKVGVLMRISREISAKNYRRGDIV